MDRIRLRQQYRRAMVSIGSALELYARLIGQITDPSSRQRGRYKITNSQLSKENLKDKKKICRGTRWLPDTKTDWPTDCQS
jgi:hypothetical protein